jgi:hypothetical protein
MHVALTLLLPLRLALCLLAIDCKASTAAATLPGMNIEGKRLIEGSLQRNVQVMDTALHSLVRQWLMVSPIASAAA